MPSLTGATAVYSLGITDLFDSPQQLSGFAADDIFETEAIKSIETYMGVDGKLSAGYVFVPIEQMINLQADSPSNDIFDQWFASQQAATDVFFANATVLLTALGKKWSLSRGVLSTYKPLPDVKKLIQPRKYGITWNTVSPSPV